MGVDEPVAAGLGDDEVQIGVVRLQLHDVAGIRLGDNDIAGRQVVGVVVAGEAADLALVFLLLDQVDRFLHALVGRVLGRSCPATDMIMPSPSWVSESRLTLPLKAGSHRSSILVIGRLVAALL